MDKKQAGSEGGKKKNPKKGFGSMTTERRKEISALAHEAKRRKQSEKGEVE